MGVHFCIHFPANSRPHFLGSSCAQSDRLGSSCQPPVEQSRDGACLADHFFAMLDNDGTLSPPRGGSGGGPGPDVLGSRSGILPSAAGNGGPQSVLGGSCTQSDMCGSSCARSDMHGSSCGQSDMRGSGCAQSDTRGSGCGQSAVHGSSCGQSDMRGSGCGQSDMHGSSCGQSDMFGSSCGQSKEMGLSEALGSSGQPPTEALGVTVSNPLSRESNNHHHDHHHHQSPSGVDPAAHTAPPQSTRKKPKKAASTKRKMRQVYEYCMFACCVFLSIYFFFFFGGVGRGSFFFFPPLFFSSHFSWSYLAVHLAAAGPYPARETSEVVWCSVVLGVVVWEWLGSGGSGSC